MAKNFEPGDHQREISDIRIKTGGGLVARSLLSMGWSLANQSDVDRCHEVSRRIWLEPRVALQMLLDSLFIVSTRVTKIFQYEAGRGGPAPGRKRKSKLTRVDDVVFIFEPWLILTPSKRSI